MENLTLNELTKVVQHGGGLTNVKSGRISPSPNSVKASLLLGFADTVAIIASVVLSIFVRNAFLPQGNIFLETLPLIAGISPVFMVSFYLRGLYPGFGMDSVEELKNITISSTFIFSVLGAITFLGKSSWDYSRLVFFLSWLLTLISIPMGRHLIRKVFAKKTWWGLPVMVIGAGNSGEKIISTLNKHPHIGLKPKVAIDDNPDRWGYHENVPVVGGESSISSISKALEIDTAIIAMPRAERDKQRMIVDNYGSEFDHLIIIPDLYGVSNLWVAPRDIGGIFGLEIQQKLLRRRSAFKKRAVDILVGSFLCLISLPLFIFISILIILDSRGGVFFRQERMGKNDSRFSMLKFRTMHIDAEQRLQQILNDCPEMKEEYEKYHKLRKDPRLTRVGRFLRKFSLDELPQFFHVISGEMSLVGPRAYMPWEKSKMGGNDEMILKVKPGLSGLWQVTNRADSSFEERANTDVYYIRNWSLFLDFYILAKTVIVVITGRGAY